MSLHLISARPPVLLLHLFRNETRQLQDLWQLFKDVTQISDHSRALHGCMPCSGPELHQHHHHRPILRRANGPSKPPSPHLPPLPFQQHPSHPRRCQTYCLEICSYSLLSPIREVSPPRSQPLVSGSHPPSVGHPSRGQFHLFYCARNSRRSAINAPLTPLICHAIE